MSGPEDGDQPSDPAVRTTFRPLLPWAIWSWPPGGSARLSLAPALLAVASGVPGREGWERQGARAGVQVTGRSSDKGEEA